MTRDENNKDDRNDELAHPKAVVSSSDDPTCYQLAFEDTDFLNDDYLRPMRLQLEFLKPEIFLRRQAIHSTIVVFGSARIPSPAEAESLIAHAEQDIRQKGEDQSAQAALTYARKQLKRSRYYEEARKFGALVSDKFQDGTREDFVVVTGGGPGIMEAANRGAGDVGARSIGLNISLPHEQEPNPYISRELCFQFRYFALRKMHFLLRARALVAFPGGYGTLDEVFEVLTLIQTGKVVPIPVILVGREFWTRAVDFDFLVEEGNISAEERDLFTIVDDAEQAIKILEDFYECKGNKE